MGTNSCGTHCDGKERFAPLVFRVKHDKDHATFLRCAAWDCQGPVDRLYGPYADADDCPAWDLFLIQSFVFTTYRTVPPTE